MTSSRWQRVNELFHEALEREPAHRADFLAAACGDVRELHTEVDSLLASHDEADGFIEKPAFEVAADLLGSDSLPADAEEDPLIGESLGPYRVIEAVGHGGMGVVYRAEDTRLGRDVAIKALASHLTRDERSRERLRREARAAAALGHPGIATVFALEEFGDQLYVVYELVEGRTLRDELIDGPLDREHVVSTALEVAEALCAAHRQGIVHRDLKPENIMRAADGKVKILDFGLAIFEASSSSAVTDSAGNRDVDSSPQRLTLPGMVLGTPSYMSPEQLRGRTVDARFDIFSFGVLLYELASGTHPFEGGDPASTIARILEVEPLSLADAGEADGSELAAILARCLPKDPEDRYADAADLVANLERIAPSTTAADERPSRLPREPRALVDACPLYLLLRATTRFGGGGFTNCSSASVTARCCIRCGWRRSGQSGAAARFGGRRYFFSHWFPSALPRICVFTWCLRRATTRASLIAIGTLVLFTLIEPTTAQAAFPPQA